MSSEATPVPPPIPGDITKAKPVEEAPQGPKGIPDAKTASMVVESMADLKKLSPETWRASMEAVANTILRQMREHQERMKKISREAQRR